MIFFRFCPRWQYLHLKSPSGSPGKGPVSIQGTESSYFLGLLNGQKPLLGRFTWRLIPWWIWSIPKVSFQMPAEILSILLSSLSF